MPETKRKVTFIMTVRKIMEIDMADYSQADDLDDATEQILAEYQDEKEQQHSLLEDADIVEVSATKLIVR